jgi:DNA-binding response OmpR family regulator
LRRFGVPAAITNAEPLDGLILSIDETVRVGGRDLHLTAAQNGLLYLFAANAGRPLSISEIRQFAWGMQREGSDDQVTERVRRLGRLLRESHGPAISSHGDSFVMM